MVQHRRHCLKKYYCCYCYNSLKCNCRVGAICDVTLQDNLQNGAAVNNANAVDSNQTDDTLAQSTKSLANNHSANESTNYSYLMISFIYQRVVEKRNRKNYEVNNLTYLLNRGVIPNPIVARPCAGLTVAVRSFTHFSHIDLRYFSNSGRNWPLVRMQLD